MELRQLQELKRNVPQYRKDFIRLVSRQDSELDAVLDDLVDENMQLVKDNSSGDKIQDKDKILLALSPLFVQFGKDLLDIMFDKNTDAGEIQRAYQTELVRKEYVGAAGFSSVFNAWQKTGENYVDDIAKRLQYRTYPTSSYTVGGQIKTIEKESVNVVRSILEVGIRQGKGAREIANDIAMYIKPLPEGQKVSPFQWIRDYLGRTKVVRIEKGLVPAGSVSFNAFRIARTEINNTFRHAVIDLHKGQPWLKGYVWNLSASHPRTDICDDYARESPYTDAKGVPDPHPHCMCFITILLKLASEIDWS